MTRFRVLPPDLNMWTKISVFRASSEDIRLYRPWQFLISSPFMMRSACRHPNSSQYDHLLATRIQHRLTPTLQKHARAEIVFETASVRFDDPCATIGSAKVQQVSKAPQRGKTIPLVDIMRGTAAPGIIVDSRV